MLNKSGHKARYSIEHVFTAPQKRMTLCVHPQPSMHSTTQKNIKMTPWNMDLHQKQPSDHYLSHKKVLFKYSSKNDLEGSQDSRSHNGLIWNRQIDLILQIIEQFQTMTRKHGYFYCTRGMINLDEQGQSVDCRLNPNPNSNYHFYPIIKRSKKQAEIEFYSQLKSILKELFPKFPLPPPSTYRQLKSCLQSTKLKKQQQREEKLIETTQTLARVKSEEQILKLKEKKLSELIKLKSPKFIRCSSNQLKKMDESHPEPQKQTQEYQKRTMSTLLGSIKSNEGLKEAIEMKKPYFQRQYEGKKSTIVENKREESSSQGIEEDFDELFSNHEESPKEDIESEVARVFGDLLSN